MELSSVKTNGIKYEQGAGRNISRHSGELQRSIGKPDRWSSDSRQPDGGRESSLRLAKQYQKLVKGNKGNPGHNASGYSTSVQRSYQSDPTNLESTHPNSNVGSGNPGSFDLRSPNNIQRSPAIVRRQTSSVFQTVPGMANYDDLGAWLEKQLPALHEALKTLDVETENSEEKFKEDEVVYLSDKIYDYLRNRLDIENERTGWRVSQWVH